MRIALIIIFILILLFLQIGIFPHLKIANAYPNLIFLAIISSAILKGWKNNLEWTIVSGIFLDFYGMQNIIGITAFALLLTSILAQLLNQKFFKKGSRVSMVLICLASSLFYELVLAIIFKIFGAEFNFSILGLAAKMIYNAILILPIFYIIKWYVDKVKQIQN